MPDLTRLIATVAAASAGGFLFHTLGLPLPWMLGALFVTMAAAVAGAPVRAPMRIRPAVVALIGVLLGSRFTPEVASQAAAWAGALVLLALHVATVCALVVPFYRIVGGFDRATAFFSGVPGGLTEMVEAGEAAAPTCRRSCWRTACGSW